VRGLVLSGGAAFFAAGERVFELAPGSDRPRSVARLSGEVTALAAGCGLLAAGTRAGQIALIKGGREDRGDGGAREEPRTIYAGRGPVLGLAIAGWNGSPRVLAGDLSPRVAAFDTDGALLESYPAASPLGLVAAGCRGVWALSADRRVLQTWESPESSPTSWTSGRAISDLAALQGSHLPRQKKSCPAGA
ncbi:MAG: hypothetical protein HY720_26895, partial [Planctomycetes bacterium]|nr:hypothetical protein [Planctomycetota bacterium]